MDTLLISIRDIKAACSFKGSLEELTSSGLISKYCIDKRLIAKIPPQGLAPEERGRYTKFLTELTKEYLSKHPKVRSWEDFIKQPDTRKVNKLLFEYGVRAEIFVDTDLPEIEEPKVRSKTSLTLPEFYEVCQIKFHFDGSFLSFKRIVQRQYGSFAEYCITKGYDVNTTKWESDETAIRVAEKLGSVKAVQARSKSLYKYLVDHNLLDLAFTKKTG